MAKQLDDIGAWKGVRWAKLRINVNDPIGTINPNIYGHFAEHLGRCIYEGIWVGEDSPIPNTGGIRNDVVAALRKVKPPVIHWPGGCFADDYHWQDGVGPREQRPQGGSTSTGARSPSPIAFGTQDSCDCAGWWAPSLTYIVGNVGSGTVRELRS